MEKAKQKTAVTMAQVSAQQTAQKDSNLVLEMSEKSVSLINSYKLTNYIYHFNWDLIKAHHISFVIGVNVVL